MRKGFTMVEVLVYVAIFSILAVVFSAALITYSRVNLEQTARSEISSQLSFVLQTIQTMVTGAGAVVVRSDGSIDIGQEWDEEDSIPAGSSYRYLVLKTKNEGGLADDANSPVVIYAQDGAVKVRKGRGSLQTEQTLTSSRVVVNNLAFTKLFNYPGRDIVEISLSLSYNGSYPSQISRNLILGVGRAEAAVFDTSLLPGTGGSIDLGQQTQRWRDGYFSNNLLVGVKTDTSSLVVGSGGTPISGIHSGTFLVDPPSIGANANGIFSVTFPVAVGASDRIFLTPPQDLSAGLVLVGARTVVPNQIEITLRNTTAAAVNGVSGSWAYLLIK